MLSLSVFSASDFFAALVAGLALTLAFQLVFMLLSVAAGISFAGIVHEPKEAGTEADGHSHHLGSAIRRIGARLGLWAVVTSSLAQFFACVVALRLIGMPRASIAISLSLVIWAVSTIIFSVVEFGLFSSLSGSLFRAATNGLKMSLQMVGQSFSESPEERVAAYAENVFDSLRHREKEQSGGRRLGDEIRHFLNDIAPQRINPERIQMELRTLLTDAEIAIVSAPEHVGWDAVMDSLHVKVGFSKEKARRYAASVIDALHRLREEMQPAGGIKKPVGEQVDAVKQRALGKLEQYLNSLGRPELSYDAVRADFEKALKDPTTGGSELLERLKRVDRDTIKAILSSRKGTTPEDAERIISKIETMCDKAAGAASKAWTATERRLLNAKFAALDALEETRKTSAKAAWWALTTAVASGAAASLGGWVAFRLGVVSSIIR